MKRKLTLSKLIKRAYERNGYVSAIVFGEMGIGKTSYALHVAAQVYGSWDKALDCLFFKPQDAIRVMRKALDSGKRIPVLIMDDAGFWLGKLTWWERQKVMFMDFYNLIRTVCAGIIFTSPTDELPKIMRKKMYFRVGIQPLPRDKVDQLLKRIPGDVLRKLEEEGRDIRYWNIAKGYKLQTLPSFMQFVRATFEDIYPLHYPRHIYERYEEIRRQVVREALDKVEEAFAEKEFEEHLRKNLSKMRIKREELKKIAKDMKSEGISRRVIVKFLKAAGIPERTAYKWLQDKH